MPEPESTSRRVALVVGTESSSTRVVAATLAALGAGDLGVGEPGRWVAGLHGELLDRVGVEVDDARPTAWFETGKSSANGITRGRLTQWLGDRFVHPDGDRIGQPRPEVVVGEPGLGWWLGLWRAAALRCDAEVVHVIVLQPPAPVAQAGAVAAWLNRVLHLERATRDSARVFLNYAEVALDWTVPFVALGRELGLRSVQEATANQIRRAHEVVAAGGSAAVEVARAATATSATAPATGALPDLADRTWAALTKTGEPDPGELDPGELDELRAAYLVAYATAESMTGSSVRAAVRAATVVEREPAPGSVRDRAGRGVRRALGR